MAQKKQSEWHDQWSLMSDNELFLFQDWIKPNTMAVFKDKDVLECGCGGGQHTSFVAPYARHITAVDLNTVDIARERNKDFSNVTFLGADIADMDLKKQFDVVFSIGVVHHTDDPDKTVSNLIRHVNPGGIIILWVYSLEGNWLVKNLVEQIRKIFLLNLSRSFLQIISKVITFSMYFPIYSLYLLPFKWLPFYEYFGNFRKLSFHRNTLNVFDKLNAPQVDFISKERIKKWFVDEGFQNLHISHYKGVSWRVSAKKKI